MTETVRVTQDEWWPVYSPIPPDVTPTVGTGVGYEVTLPDGTLDRYQAALAEFDEVQALLGNAFNAASAEATGRPPTPPPA